MTAMQVKYIVPGVCGRNAKKRKVRKTDECVEKYCLNNPENWRPYGGNQNNAGAFENQQSSPENALVEKITNSIDAILMKQCLVWGINRKTPNVAVFDNGEGQNPADFPNTFLSFAHGNKNDIPFVQGKYNFGATGAVFLWGSASLLNDNFQAQSGIEGW